MNTGFLGPAVATVLTVYGIETKNKTVRNANKLVLQQYLPFTVLKLMIPPTATVPLVMSCNSTYRLRY